MAYTKMKMITEMVAIHFNTLPMYHHFVFEMHFDHETAIKRTVDYYKKSFTNSEITQIYNDLMKKGKVRLCWEVHQIKGVKLSHIDWVIECEGCEIEDEDEEEEILSGLPIEAEYNLPFISSDADEIKSFIKTVEKKLMDKYGFPISQFNYDLIGIDGKLYEFWHEI